jgi:hypothetical protein
MCHCGAGVGLPVGVQLLDLGSRENVGDNVAEMQNRVLAFRQRRQIVRGWSWGGSVYVCLNCRMGFVAIVYCSQANANQLGRVSVQAVLLFDSVAQTLPVEASHGLVVSLKDAHHSPLAFAAAERAARASR